ncbi:MAG: transposase [Planctomycetales bacterium]|nr:transposase [Planctomycetales bacterium]
MALELLDPSRTNGLQFDTLIFDEYYGGKPDFLKGLDEREQSFLAEVPKSFRVLMKRPRGPRPKKGWTGKHRQPREVQRSVAPATVAPATVAKRATRASRSGVGRAGRTSPSRARPRTDRLAG